MQRDRKMLRYTSLNNVAFHWHTEKTQVKATTFFLTSEAIIRSDMDSEVI